MERASPLAGVVLQCEIQSSPGRGSRSSVQSPILSERPALLTSIITVRPMDLPMCCSHTVGFGSAPGWTHSSPWQKSRGPRYGQTGPDSNRRRSADPKPRRGADPKSRRGAGPKPRRGAGPKPRRGDNALSWEESATTKTAPFRRNPWGAGGPPTYQTEAAGAPQALSGIGKAGHDVKTAPVASVSNLGARSSLRAANPKTPARGPQDFCHGLLGRAEMSVAEGSSGVGEVTCLDPVGDHPRFQSEAHPRAGRVDSGWVIQYNFLMVCA